MTQLESLVGVPEFEIQSKSIPLHRVTTNGAAGAGSRPSPGAHLMVPWKHAGADRCPDFAT